MDRTIAHHSRWGSLGCVAEQRYQDSVWSDCIRAPMAESAVLLFSLDEFFEITQQVRQKA